MARQERWSTHAIGSQQGRTAVVTGANSGIGFQTAKALAAHGARVVLASRDAAKADDAVVRLTDAVPGAQVSSVPLDLASLASVRRAAEEISTLYPRVDLLINNAGVMMTPYSQTEDGFELQLGTNHLGHFALTGLLLPNLLAVPGSRIVTVSSIAHGRGQIDLADPHFQRRPYRPTVAYGQSKLANLMFTYELQRRLAASNASTVAVAACPGAVATNLQQHAPVAVRVLGHVLMRFLGQPNAAIAALPTLRAATDPAARGGEYYGPDGFQGWRGYPVRVESSPLSHDVQTQLGLWTESERLTGVTLSTQDVR